MSEIEEWEVGEEEVGERLDVFMTKRGLVRSEASLRVRGGGVHRREGGDWQEVLKTSHRVKKGEVYRIRMERASKERVLEGEEMALSVLYEDEGLLVLNKPSGLVVHPGAGHWKGTLVHGLLWRYGEDLSGVGGEERPGIVHRLDKDTTGLMVVAKNDVVHRGLSKQLEERKLRREYEVVVWGRFLSRGLRVDAPIGRDERRREAFRVREGGREAVSTFWTKESLAGGEYTLVGCKLETGRTHQIRVHLAYKGYEVVGDKVYGRKRLGRVRRQGLGEKSGLLRDCREAAVGFPRQALHARRMVFSHPLTGEAKEFEAPRPDDMEELLKILRGV